MSELKPCPFCGGENIAVGSDKGTVYRHNTAFGDLTRSVPTVRWAYCVDCGCVAPAEKVNNFDGFYKPDEQEDALNRAISAWNRRAQPAPAQDDREARDWEMKAQGIESVIHYVVSKRDQDLLRQHAAYKRAEAKRLAPFLAREIMAV